MANDEKLTKQLAEYHELAKVDKKIDVASLMINALQSQELNNLSGKQKRWAYLISLAVPPFGLIFAIKFYYSGKDDGEQAAWICGALTAFSIFVFILFARLIFTGSGLSLDQVNKIKPSDIQQLVQ